ncbi:tetratricopeptide repeat protein [Candidatus Protochlamydia phocaeensis]|uniref:tetratricopeptide repeat protein n=1 Tax=Candidatus Protochlamydia phocaeensis TaxID=1414722 RepID=UPI000B27E48E|nr:tetratricopeptide repeat protein [Candidatus Protochlamydia phocaeensis]
MKKRFISSLLVLTFMLGASAPIYAARTKNFACQEDAEKYMTALYNQACHYYNHQEWRNAANEFEKVIYFFPDSDAAADASFYLGTCYFEMKEYDFANAEFSNYIKASNQPEFFEDAVTYKFCCAEHFKIGKKRRPFKLRYFPKWISGQELALTIYDEVIVALPNHELTVRALYSKAELLQKMENYRECIDTYQTLIRRFPKDEITPACYLKIAEAYCQQSVYEFQNPDILALAELNARKFSEEFPRDERVAIADGYVLRIKENYARGLCNTGRFYERMDQPAAASIYYQSAIEEFPDTYAADFSRSRLRCLGFYEEEEENALCGASEEPVPVPAQEESFFNESTLPLEEAAPIEDIVSMPRQAAIVEEDEEEQHAPFLHYSLLKKREMRCNGNE